jgi:hypothetical protein
MYFIVAVVVVAAVLVVAIVVLDCSRKMKKARTSDMKCNRNVAILVAQDAFKRLLF